MAKFSIPDSLIKLDLSWTDFKKYLNGTIKILSGQSTIFSTNNGETTFDFYQVIALDSQFAYICIMPKVAVPEQGSDQKDFEDNWLALCNKQLTYTDTNRGALAIKPSIHKIGFTKCPISFYFDMGNSSVETKHQPFAANLSKSYDADKKCTRLTFTVPFANGMDIEGSEFGLNSPEDLDIFRAWAEHPSYPGVVQCYFVHSYLVETNKKDDLVIKGPTCSSMPAGMKLIFEYYSMTTDISKHMVVNLLSWLNLTTQEKALYEVPII